MSVFTSQCYLLAALFAIAGVTKIAARHANLGKTGVGEIVRARFGPAALTPLRRVWLGLGGLEIGLALLLALRFWSTETAIAVLAVMVASSGYLTWVLRRRAGSSCGCFGTSTPASWRGIARALLLAVAGGCYLFACTAKSSIATVSLPLGALIIAAEVAVFIALSDELRPWSAQLRIEVDRLLAPMRGEDASATFRSEVEALGAWQAIAATRIEPSRLTDAWRDRDWQYFSYTQHQNPGELTLVAARHLRVRPPWIRLAMIEESDRVSEVVDMWDSTTHEQEPVSTGTQETTLAGVNVL